MMNRLSSTIAASKAAMALLTGLLLIASQASAKDHNPKTENAARVVAHIPMDGLSAVDMTLQRKAENKYYLYVQHAADQGISVIDVAKPAQAKLLGVNAWPDPAMSGRMNVAGGLALIDETAVPAMRSKASTDDLVLWDMSNPTSPRIVQKFSGVVKWLEDERSFIYVLNNDGLWVISEPIIAQPAQESETYAGG
jgi:hypothetical protein